MSGLFYFVTTALWAIHVILIFFIGKWILEGKFLDKWSLEIKIAFAMTCFSFTAQCYILTVQTFLEYVQEINK